MEDGIAPEPNTGRVRISNIRTDRHLMTEHGTHEGGLSIIATMLAGLIHAGSLENHPALPILHHELLGSGIDNRALLGLDVLPKSYPHGEGSTYKA